MPSNTANNASARCPHVEFDHRDGTTRGDEFYAVYAEIRQEGIVWSDRYGGFWIVSGYDDARTVLADWESFSSADGCFLPDLGYRSVALEQDPPEHDVFRKLFATAVGRKAVLEAEPKLAAMIDRVVDEFAAQGGGDARALISEKIPVEAVALMFGLSPEVSERLRGMTTEAWQRMDKDPDALAPLGDMLIELVDQRRAKPREDFLSRLPEARVDGRPLTDAEIANFLVGAVVAGHETTMNASSNLMAELAKDPSEQDRLRAQPEMIGTVIDESLRHRAPIHMFFRTVARPVTIDGKELRPGEKVAVVYASANRDPKRFPDPDEFCPDRADAGRHVSFGWGIHRCVGAFMAQTELRLLVTALLAAGTIRMAGEPTEAPLEGGAHMGFKSLPLTLTA